MPILKPLWLDGITPEEALGWAIGDPSDCIGEGWGAEHGKDYDIPKKILELERIQDLSWHNDVCPCFGKTWFDDDLCLQVAIWVDHPDPDKRYDRPDAKRFLVQAHSWQPLSASIVEDAGLPDAADGDSVLETDDVDLAIIAFLGALVKLQASLRASEALGLPT